MSICHGFCSGSLLPILFTSYSPWWMEWASFLGSGLLFSAQHLLLKVRDALGLILALCVRKFGTFFSSEGWAETPFYSKWQSPGFSAKLPIGGTSPYVMVSSLGGTSPSYRNGGHSVIDKSSFTEQWLLSQEKTEIDILCCRAIHFVHFKHFICLVLRQNLGTRLCINT